uniref:Uncharacterized protein n=2 Tax=Physcomitrium patens TaxID=3218 RepID=A9SME2_PHYPA|nr:hypothetical protein PHYPA_025095 [Physcomitrium patens]
MQKYRMEPEAGSSNSNHSKPIRQKPGVAISLPSAKNAIAVPATGVCKTCTPTAAQWHVQWMPFSAVGGTYRLFCLKAATRHACSPVSQLGALKGEMQHTKSASTGN